MKLISWNVNGIRAVQGKGFPDFIKEENPDVLCLQEVKAKQDQIDFSFDGYTVFWNAAEKPGYSGTAVYTKIQPLKATYDMGIPEHDKEGRVITLEFKEFILVTVYTPNSGEGLKRLSYRGDWDKAFRKYVKTLEKSKPVIICGDLNVAHTELDIKNAKANYNKSAGYTQQEIDSFEALLKEGFVDTFREFEKGPGHYTYWSYMFNARKSNAGWRIDYFLVSKPFMKKVKKSDILKDVLGSDHCPVRLEL